LPRLSFPSPFPVVLQFNFANINSPLQYSLMPPRKEPKETVTYPASKRKPPPFKPQRPSQVPRVASANSESASRPLSRTPSANVATAKNSTSATAKRSTSDFAPVGRGIFGRVGATGGKRKGRAVEDDEDDDDDEIENTVSKRSKATGQDGLVDSDDDLADDPLTAKPRAPPHKAPPKRGRPPSRKEPAPLEISDDEDGNNDPSLSNPVSPNGDLEPPVPSQSSEISSIPRALLLRLMHEHFESKDTKIDKHALGVLEKYFEIYIRETIARSLLAKKEVVDGGAASQDDENWLEKTDLERVVAGVVMDF
jgi:hypothetical protein